MRVSLREQRSFEVSVSGAGGSGEPQRVAGLLRWPARGFGSGSVWELVAEGSGKVHFRHTLFLLDPGMWHPETARGPQWPFFLS